MKILPPPPLPARTWAFAATVVAAATSAHAINLAHNPAAAGFPHPLDSDPGWGAGTHPWEIVDGISQYPDFQHGLAFTGGSGGWGGQPGGMRQATINLGTPAVFDEAVVWHHGADDVPMNAALEYYDRGQWKTIFARKFDPNYPITLTGWSRPDNYQFQPVTGSMMRYSFDNSQLSMQGNPMRHGWIYEMEVFDAATGTNLARNATRTSQPDPLASDPGWGAATDPWDIVDGVTQYDHWAEGLAFTGGSGNFGGQPAGRRQATIDFGQPVDFDEITVWHHGADDVPAIARLEYFDGAQWKTIFDREYDANFATSGSGGSKPDAYRFQPVDGSRFRYAFDNNERSLSGNPMRHGWIYEIELEGYERGDFDINGIVDGDDFLAWQQGFGMPDGAVRSDGDGDGDGDVDGDDFLLWQQQFAAGSARMASAAVPEPATTSLLLVVLATLGMPRLRAR